MSPVRQAIWINPEIQLMIKDRQKAFHCGNVLIWQSMKCKVQKEIIARKKSFYKNKVKYLRKDDCRKWWNVVNKMSGRPTRASNFSFERDGNIMSQHDLVKTLNEFFVSVNSDIPALDVNTLPSFLPAKERIPTIQPYEVCKKMRAIKPFKAHGPDEVPCYLMKEFAYELAEPVMMIFNESLKSGIVPAIWKDPNVTPIPKTHQPVHESDIRPISLTSCLSEILEDWLIYGVKDKIDPNQFGCLKGTSTTYCLLDMVHKWLLHLDFAGNHLRLCFLDFTKAFDPIGYNVLIEKLIELGVRRSLLPWIIDFLTNRRQRVKIGEIFFICI